MSLDTQTADGLALCVINEGASYKARCDIATSRHSKRKKYAMFRTICARQAKKHAAQFGELYTADIVDGAAREVQAYMARHALEL